jgi:hypothetical protein
MVDVVVYFFRQQKLFFYFGLLSLSVVYSYSLALYFLELSSFAIHLFNLLTGFSFLWLVTTYVSFFKNKQTYAYGREKEKYNLLRDQITLRYKLDIKDNIFLKIDLITSFMKDTFSAKGLLSIRVLKVTNAALHLYTENLKIKEELTKALSISSDSDKEEFYQNEIRKNSEQNLTIEKNLDNFIHELMGKNNNDNKIEKLLKEFEHATYILTKIDHK